MSAASKANEPSMEEILASIRRIIADDTGQKDVAAPQPSQPATEFEDDVLDLATVPEAASTSFVSAPLRAAADDIEFRETPSPAPKPAPPVEAPAEPARAASAIVEPVRPQAEPEALLSPEVNASVAQAFGALGSVLVPQGGRTIEDLVKELMRPMLKSWLDENLPGLVERLVRAEIERVSRGLRG